MAIQEHLYVSGRRHDERAGMQKKAGPCSRRRPLERWRSRDDGFGAARREPKAGTACPSGGEPIPVL